jgi:hypothetical protein
MSLKSAKETMKRPQFFEDLDRELHGEPEQPVVPPAVPQAKAEPKEEAKPVARMYGPFSSERMDDLKTMLDAMDAEIARSAQAWAAREPSGLDRSTATGAMIAADYEYFKQAAQMPVRQRAYDSIFQALGHAIGMLGSGFL